MALTLHFGPGIDDLNVLNEGAVGDGVTDDVPAIKAAIATAKAAGVGVVFPRTAAGYFLGSKDIPASVWSGCIRVPPNMRIRGNNTKLIMGTDTEFFRIASRSPDTDTIVSTAGPIITADTVPTDDTVTVDDSSSVAVGQDVRVVLGQSPIGIGDWAWWFFAKVKTIPDSTHVQLDRPVCYALSVAGTPDTQHRKIYPLTELAENIVIDGFDCVNPMVGPARSTEGVYAQVARNITLDNMTGENPGAGLLTLEECDNVSIPRVMLRTCAKQSGLGAFGRGLSFASSKNVHVGVADLRDCENQFVFIEVRCENININTLKIENGYPGRSTTAVPLIQHSYLSRVRYGNIFVTGNPSYFYSTGGATPPNVPYAKIAYASFAMSADPLLSTVSDVETMSIRGFDYYEVKRYSKTFALTPSMSAAALPLPSGICRRMRIYASSTTGITILRLSDGTTNSSDVKASLVAGQSAPILLASGLDALGNYVMNNTEGKRLVISTDGTLVAGTFLTVEMEYFVAQGVADDGAAAREDDMLQRATLRAITYSASMTPDASGQRGTYQQIVVTNGTAMTINAPTTPLVGQTMTIEILNSSGGAMGVITWNAVFKLAGAFVNPANTLRRTIQFIFNGTNWIETNRAAADI